MNTRLLPAGEGTCIRQRKKELAILLHYSPGQCTSITVASPTPLNGYGTHLYLNSKWTKFHPRNGLILPDDGGSILSQKAKIHPKRAQFNHDHDAISPQKGEVSAQQGVICLWMEHFLPKNGIFFIMVNQIRSSAKLIFQMASGYQ